MDKSFDNEDSNGDDFQNSGDEGDEIQGAAPATVVQNQPFDEEVALSDTDSFTGRDEPPKVTDASLIESQDMDDMGPSVQVTGPSFADPGTVGSKEAKPGRLSEMAQSSGADFGIEAEEGPGVYNALEFRHLNVTEDIKSLFDHIGRYKPQHIELETKLKPFIPDYIPSIGGIDEFIKVPRPDGKPDYLGLKVLDEPAARQSDPTVLTLQLRQLSKETPGNKAEMIGRIHHSDEQKERKIDSWIESVANIHKDKPPASVQYTQKMPDIEALMQEWPPEMESFIRSMKLPSGILDLDLKTMTKMICTVLDIPVYGNPIESLHLLFSLYLEFKSNPIFGSQMVDLNQHRMQLQSQETTAMGNTAAGGSWRGNIDSAGSMGAGTFPSASIGGFRPSGAVPHEASSEIEGANMMTL